jgi:hypothetical protein
MRAPQTKAINSLRATLAHAKRQPRNQATLEDVARLVLHKLPGEDAEEPRHGPQNRIIPKATLAPSIALVGYAGSRFPPPASRTAPDRL